MTNKGKCLELYFHIPFCIKKCLYCDFLSAPAEEGVRRAYMEALEQETWTRAREYGDYTVDSVFVGGGTPSVAETGQLTGLLAAVREGYRLAEDAEITVEVNPGTADLGKLAAYRAAGVNRLSIGLQTANEEELGRIGRIHTMEQFRTTYAAAVTAGFININVDVMSALPGQSPESWKRTLHALLELEPRPTHISAYSLIPEEGTRLWEMLEKGELTLPDEDTDRLMYVETKRILGEAGFRRYEISNYARPGFCCRHNCGYWTRQNYLGLGIGAASLIENVRFRNGDDLSSYLEHPLDCREEIHALSLEEQMEEFMFLGLRLTKGVDVSAFRENFGRMPEEVYRDVIEKNIRDGLLEYGDGTDRLALTDRGLDLASYVMAQFLLT